LSAVSRYRIDTAIGAGGMGEVYRGTDTVLERAVAIKFLTRHTSDQSAPQQLLSEARSASALSHPNVCTIYEVSESEGRPCIVMEFIEGQSLSTIIPPGVGLPVDTTISYGIQIADALAHAHDAGVIHRDLKSANIIVTPQQRVKVLDFGLAVQETDKGVDDETSTVDELKSGSDAGTPGTLRYLAPEVLRGERADRQSDIWALGAVLYEMAAGKRPFNGRTPHEISAAILTQSPEPLPSEVPTGLRSIIRTCLTKERARRYHSASEIRAALQALQLDLQASGGAPPISRRAAVLLGIGLLAAVVLALGISIAALLRRDVVSPSTSVMAEAPPPPPAKYLAVLPDVPPGSTREQAVLTEAVVEDMIHRIASVPLPGVKVIAFPSVLRLKNDTADPILTAYEELNAAFVVTIKVATSAKRLTFTAVLADPTDRSQIWGRPYDGTPDDMFAIEGQVAAHIVDALIGRLSPNRTLSQDERNKLTDQPTQNFTAYRLYAEGRRFWYTPTATPDGYRKSIAFYDKAIEKDPQFALAYLGKADAIGSLAWEGWIPTSEGHKATVDALKTIEGLDPGLGQAHYTRAGLKWMERDWAAADAEYQLAIEMVPGSVMNKRFYAYFLLGRQRVKDARRVLQEALDADREGFATNLAMATMRYWTGDWEGAISRLTELIDIDPSNPATAVAREILSDVYESKGRLRPAILLREQALRMNGEVREAAELKHDYEASGSVQTAMHNFYYRQLNAAAMQTMNGTYVSPVYVAVLYIHLDDKDKAFEYLEKAVRESAPWLSLLRVDPAFKPLRGDPRFEKVVRDYEHPAAPPFQ
jgi:serine/threonine protein kinase/tetratricopeptide (TPR) repeat protein